MPESTHAVAAAGRSQDRLRLVLMGTGPFAVPAFEALAKAGHEIPLVITRPMRQVRSRSGPPSSPVRRFAENAGLPPADPPTVNSGPMVDRLRELAADLFVVCDFGEILSKEVLSLSRLGGINLHGSLLPAYRGAAPVQWAVLSGDRISGVSVIHMTPRLDGGPILATAQTEIGPRETAGELEQRLAVLGVEPTLEAVRMLARWDGRSLIGTAQDAAKVSRAPRLDKASGRIDWSLPAAKIDCHVRGMQPWPGAFSELVVAPDKPPLRVVVREVTVIDDATPADPADVAPGTLVSDRELIVAAGKGRVRIERLQAAGKSEVSGEAFLRGYRLGPGCRFMSAASR